MARNPRIEYAGTLYHVFNRGNYRASVFAHAKTAAAFEAGLFETCELTSPGRRRQVRT